jgi:hypothetical protein
MNIVGQPLPNHAQIRCTTVDNNEMDIGICSECVLKGVSLDTCNAVLEGIKDYWIFEIDANKNMEQEEKEQRKEFHNSHTIETITEIIDTGSRAQAEATEQGVLE